MAISADAALFHAYSVQRDVIRRALQASVAREYREAVDPQNIVASLDAVADRLALLVREGQVQTAALTGGYLRQLALQQIDRVIEPELPEDEFGENVNGDSLQDGMAAHGPMMLQQFSKIQTQDPGESLGEVLNKVLEYGEHLYTRFADRETTRMADRTMEIQKGPARPPNWRGVVSPSACLPCQNRNSGVHPMSQKLYRHGSCNCDRAPTYAPTTRAKLNQQIVGGELNPIVQDLEQTGITPEQFDELQKKYRAMSPAAIRDAIYVGGLDEQGFQNLLRLRYGINLQWDLTDDQMQQQFGPDAMAAIFNGIELYDLQLGYQWRDKSTWLGLNLANDLGQHPYELGPDVAHYNSQTGYIEMTPRMFGDRTVMVHELAHALLTGDDKLRAGWTALHNASQAKLDGATISDQIIDAQDELESEQRRKARLEREIADLQSHLVAGEDPAIKMKQSSLTMANDLITAYTRQVKELTAMREAAKDSEPWLNNYSSNSTQEDFAESMELYMSDPARLKQIAPQRYALLASLYPYRTVNVAG